MMLPWLCLGGYIYAGVDICEGVDITGGVNIYEGVDINGGVGIPAGASIDPLESKDEAPKTTRVTSRITDAAPVKGV